jgi:hypothetical protein
VKASVSWIKKTKGDDIVFTIVQKKATVAATRSGAAEEMRI